MQTGTRWRPVLAMGVAVLGTAAAPVLAQSRDAYRHDAAQEPESGYYDRYGNWHPHEPYRGGDENSAQDWNESYDRYSPGEPYGAPTEYYTYDAWYREGDTHYPGEALYDEQWGAGWEADARDVGEGVAVEYYTADWHAHIQPGEHSASAQWFDW